jgi:uncharacterized protein YndB with AHSA1/START domain
VPRGHIAESEIDIAAPPTEVWAALTDVGTLGEVMFGSEVETDWSIGAPIVYRGEWQGKPFEDRGVVLEVNEPHRLRLTHATGTGDDDDPNDQHEVVYELEDLGNATHVRLTQDNNATAEAAEHASANWETMLASLKRVVERGR